MVTDKNNSLKSYDSWCTILMQLEDMLLEQYVIAEEFRKIENSKNQIECIREYSRLEGMLTAICCLAEGCNKNFYDDLKSSLAKYLIKKHLRDIELEYIFNEDGDVEKTSYKGLHHDLKQINKTAQSIMDDWMDIEEDE